MELGILSDAHGNVRAFEKALSVLKAEGASSFIFLGDAIGYIPQEGVLTHLLEIKCPCVLGNHEQKLLLKEYSKEQDKVYQFSKVDKKLTAEHKNFIQSWPQSLSLEYPAGKALFVHGTPTQPTTGYCYPDSELSADSCSGYQYIFMGNTHRPFISRFDGRSYVNIGSCGLPRDCGYFGSVCLFNTLTGKLRILRFNIASENQRAFSENQLHSSVIDLFQRESEEKIYGEVIETEKN